MIRLDRTSPVPPFEQVKQQVQAGRAAGTLRPEERLPPVRALAEELRIAPNTVARAYRELEAEGVIVTRGRNGSFVTATGDGAVKEARAAARAYAQLVRALGVADESAVALVQEALARESAGSGVTSAHRDSRQGPR